MRIIVKLRLLDTIYYKVPRTRNALSIRILKFLFTELRLRLLDLSESNTPPSRHTTETYFLVDFSHKIELTTTFLTKYLKNRRSLILRSF